MITIAITPAITGRRMKKYLISPFDAPRECVVMGASSPHPPPGPLPLAPWNRRRYRYCRHSSAWDGPPHRGEPSARRRRSPGHRRRAPSRSASAPQPMPWRARRRPAPYRRVRPGRPIAGRAIARRRAAESGSRCRASALPDAHGRTDPARAGVGDWEPPRGIPGCRFPNRPPARQSRACPPRGTPNRREG